MKIYEGHRVDLMEFKELGTHVTVDRKPLHPQKSQKIINHSPDGFNWGYPGSGPAQLALAILLDYLGKERALRYYQEFKFEFVAKWGDSWKITGDEIDQWLMAKKLSGK